MGVDRPAMRAGEDAAVVRVEVQSLMRIDEGFLAAITLERENGKRAMPAFHFRVCLLVGEMREGGCARDGPAIRAMAHGKT